MNNEQRNEEGKKADSRNGGSNYSCLLGILLLVSISLNTAFLTGCVTIDKIFGGEKPDAETGAETQREPGSGSECESLKEIAEFLSIPTPSVFQPGDYKREILLKLRNEKPYKGEVLSTNAFEECKAAIPTKKDTETFEAYHKFIKKIAGKRLIVLE